MSEYKHKNSSVCALKDFLSDFLKILSSYIVVSFQTCITFFMWDTKEDILNSFDFKVNIDKNKFVCVPKKKEALSFVVT